MAVLPQVIFSFPWSTVNLIFHISKFLPAFPYHSMPPLQYHPELEIELFKNNKNICSEVLKLRQLEINEIGDFSNVLGSAVRTNVIIYNTCFQRKDRTWHDTISGTMDLIFWTLMLCRHVAMWLQTMYRLSWLLYFSNGNYLVDEMKLDVNDWPWCSWGLPLNQ